MCWHRSYRCFFNVSKNVFVNPYKFSFSRRLSLVCYQMPCNFYQGTRFCFQDALLDFIWYCIHSSRLPISVAFPFQSPSHFSRLPVSVASPFLKIYEASLGSVWLFILWRIIVWRKIILCVCACPCSITQPSPRTAHQFCYCILYSFRYTVPRKMSVYHLLFNFYPNGVTVIVF